MSEPVGPGTRLLCIDNSGVIGVNGPGWNVQTRPVSDVLQVNSIYVCEEVANPNDYEGLCRHCGKPLSGVFLEGIRGPDNLPSVWCLSRFVPAGKGGDFAELLTSCDAKELEHA